MAADWVTRGLTHTELVDVVDVGAIYVQGRSAEGAPTDPYQLACRNGAGTVVAGSYYLATDTLVIRATVEDGVFGLDHPSAHVSAGRCGEAAPTPLLGRSDTEAELKAVDDYVS
jgi:hypothetical protein